MKEPLWYLLMWQDPENYGGIEVPVPKEEAVDDYDAADAAADDDAAAAGDENEGEGAAEMEVSDAPSSAAASTSAATTPAKNSPPPKAAPAKRPVTGMFAQWATAAPSSSKDKVRRLELGLRSWRVFFVNPNRTPVVSNIEFLTRMPPLQPNP